MLPNRRYFDFQGDIMRTIYTYPNEDDAVLRFVKVSVRYSFTVDIWRLSESIRDLGKTRLR